MSTKTTTKSTVVEPPINVNYGAQAVSPDTTVIGNSSPADHAPGLFELLAATKSSSRLDSAAATYISTIDKIFADAKIPIIGTPVSSDKIEGRMYRYGNSPEYILMLFAKSHTAIDMTPAALRSYDIASIVKAQTGVKQLLETIVVTEEDYALAGNMAAFLINTFMTMHNHDISNMTISALQHGKIVAITNIDAVRDYIRKVSPHAVPCRDDIGVLLCIEKKKETNALGYQEVEQQPFLAITGYTRILNPNEAMTGVKFVPIPTITDIVTAIPNRNLLAMALPLAADAFILQNLWLRPYSTFRTGAPNLGNLIVDPTTKKPMFADTAETFHNFIRTYMTPPFLAIDITEGRARPLGIEAMIYDRASVLTSIHRFLNLPLTIAPNELQDVMSFTNFTGTYVENGIIKDTRCVDYLDLMVKVKDPKQVSHLLLQPNQPQVRIEAVRGIYPEATRSLYNTTTVILDAAFVGMLANTIVQNNVHLGYDIPATGNCNIGSIMNSTANQFAAMQSVAQGIGRQSYCPTMYSSIYTNPFMR